jgi:hypothetical protein
MKIYVASSWRNEFQEGVVARLRTIGHQVYDFRGTGDGWGNSEDGPGGFGWHEIDADWKNWPANLDRYVGALDHPRAIEGFLRDMDALRAADICVMVNPCGQSAHAEMGWACGAGKPTAVYIAGIREPDLMVKMADIVTTSWTDVELWIDRLSIQRPMPPAVRKMRDDCHIDVLKLIQRIIDESMPGTAAIKSMQCLYDVLAEGADGFGTDTYSDNKASD